MDNQRFVILRLLKLEIGKENYNSKREDLEEEDQREDERN